MKQRQYSGEDDLQLLQNFNAEAIAQTDHCGYLHPGDIPHHIYNGNKYYNPHELLTIWEDASGVAAWLLVNVRFKGFDAQVRPDLRGGELEREVLDMAYYRTSEMVRKFGVTSDYLFAEAFRGDTTRSQLLVELGWEPDGELPYVLNRTEIKSIDLPNLPDGFVYRSAKGIEDAAALAAVHNAAFGSVWTPDLYRYVMESPGYSPERELVIEMPNGSFAAFAVIWYDHLNQMGLFEPVGTHIDYWRRGFGRAIMIFGMKKMVDAGMTSASVAHFGDNQAARGLYQSLGFRPWHLEDGYSKPVFQ